MGYLEIIEKIKPELDKVIGFLERELAKIRTAGASVSLIEDIKVECFGQQMLLKQLASISVPEPRVIVIQPWDSSYIDSIQKAIEKSNIGVNPVVDQKIIRLVLPPLTEEYRKNLSKILSEKKENARKTVRHWREEAWKEIQEKFRKGEISEDEKYKGKDKLQEVIDEYNKKIEEKVEKKEKEIML
ncbi:ribosome recycling factor [bacterium]|nr:ribosome recycling factor [bacterium]